MAPRAGSTIVWTGLVAPAPTFQTSDERYKWLNRIQAIGAGHANFETGVLVYHLYEVKVTTDQRIDDWVLALSSFCDAESPQLTVRAL